MLRLLCAVALALGLSACASAPQPTPQPVVALVAAPADVNRAAQWYSARQTLSWSGALRVGVYAGSPTSMVRDAKTGEAAGVAHDLGVALAKDFGVPVQIVEFDRLALVLDALKAGQVEMTFTNATELRARDVDFTPALLQVELGFLVPAGSKLASIADVDQNGVRIGVSQGSSSQGALPRVLKNATLVPAASLKVAQQMLQDGSVQAFATNKGILNELADVLPRSRVLDGRWGLENMAIALPKERASAMPYVTQFAQRLQRSGELQAMVVRAGLRGTVAPVAKP